VVDSKDMWELQDIPLVVGSKDTSVPQGTLLVADKSQAEVVEDTLDMLEQLLE
jgi:hypothetical protein